MSASRAFPQAKKVAPPCRPTHDSLPPAAQFCAAPVPSEPALRTHENPQRAGLPQTLAATTRSASYRVPSLPAIARSALAQALTRVRFGVLGLIAPEAAAGRALDLFCTPGPAQEAITVAGGGVETSMLNVDGHDLAMYVWGDTQQQRYVLLAHDWSGQALDHLAWVAALRAAGYAVVAFDQQAHGSSSGCQATLSDFICNLLAVGWRHGRAAAVIGHGLGGTAAAAALSRGLEADRAILIAAHADPEEAINRFARSTGIGASVRQRMMAMLERRTGVPMEELQAHRSVPKIGRPALIVHDLEDSQVPWAEGERYARHWPGARLLTTSGLGHGRVARNSQVIASCLRFLQDRTVGERVVSSPNLPYGLA